MPDVDFPFTLTNGTTADASQVQANLDAIKDALEASSFSAADGSFSTEGGVITLEGASLAGFVLTDLGAGTGLKHVRFYTNDGSTTLQALNDAQDGATSTAFTYNHATGAVTFNGVVDGQRTTLIDPTMTGGVTEVSDVKAWKQFGVVQVEGQVTFSAATGQSICNLPSGYRPPADRYFTGTNDTAQPIRLSVTPGGNVDATVPAGAASITQVYLDPIRFRV